MTTENTSHSDGEIREILRDTQTIAMVGASSNPDRPSYGVMRYLQQAGFRVIPVNPRIHEAELLGEVPYPALNDVPDQIDMVDLFRRSDAVAGVVDELLPLIAEKGICHLWMQLGVVDVESGGRARDAGLNVVMDRCLKIEHRRLMSNK